MASLKNISLNSVSQLAQKYKALLFLGLLFLLIIMEAFELKTSVNLILQSNSNQTVPLKKSQAVRIDFKNYDEVVTRINQAQTYQPDTNSITTNPFRSVK